MSNCYRIYGATRTKYKWELLTTLYQKEKIDDFISLVSAKDYSKIMVINHDYIKACDEVEDVIELEKPLERVRKR